LIGPECVKRRFMKDISRIQKYLSKWDVGSPRLIPKIKEYQIENIGKTKYGFVRSCPRRWALN
jgi:hypothetical protein